MDKVITLAKRQRATDACQPRHCQSTLAAGVARPENLDPIIRRVRDIDPTSLGIDGQAMQIAELARSLAFATPCGKEFAAFAKYLNPVVANFRNIDVVMFVEANASWSLKLSGATAGTAKFEQKLTVFVEDLNAVVL